MKRLTLVIALLVALAAPLAAEDAPAADLALFPAMEKLGGTISGVLDTNQVLGTPVKIGEVTLVPIVAKGLGFGLGEGVLGQEQTDQRGDRGGSESSKDRHGVGCGAGGFARPIALIVVNRDGKVQIHRLQESGLVGMVRALIPVLQRVVGQRLAIFKLRSEAASKAAQPQKD